MVLRAFIAVVVLLVLHGAGWFGLSVALKNTVQNWVAAQNEKGMLVSHNEPEARITGYPFSVKARLKDVVFAPNPEAPDFVWQMDHLDLKIVPLPFVFDTLHLDAKTRHTLTTQRQKFYGEPQQFEGSFNWMEAQGLPKDIFIRMSAMQFKEASSGQKIFMDQVIFETGKAEDKRFTFDLKAQQLELFTPVAGLGRKVDDLIFRGFINFEDTIQKPNVTDLTTWRDLGGVVEIERMKLDVGPLIMQGNGIIALDGDLQPVGNFTARFEGFFQTVDRLSRAGLVSGPNASLAKVVLGALAKRPENGGPLTISLPLTLQNRGFYAGPIRLAEMPKINW